MATNTAGDTGQMYHTNQIHYLSKKITFADAGTTVTVGTLPPNAAVIRGGVVVTVAFNGDSSNVLDIGVTGNTDDFATDIALGTIGVIAADDMATATSAFSASARTVVAPVVSTADADAGVGYVFVEYIVHRV
jgi:hypothetical protein